MSALRPVLPIEDGETAISWCSRLARLHSRAMFQFCADMRVSAQAILDGVGEAIATLARLGAAPPERLLATTAIRDGVSYVLAGQKLSRPSLRRERMHVCPACLNEDVARSGHLGAYGRSSWTLSAIRTCLTHGLTLVDMGGCPRRPNLVNDFARRIAPALDGLDGMCLGAKPRAGSALELYLLSRLSGGMSDRGLLDGFEWHVAAKAAEMVGVVEVFGRTPNLNALSQDDWHACGAAGFDVLSGGRERFFEFLEDLRRTTSHGLAGPQQAFGRLYQWLEFGAGSPDFDPMRRLLADFVVDRFPVAEGVTVLGLTVERRARHSVRSASVEYGIHPKRLRKLAVAAGIAQANDVDDNLVPLEGDSVKAFLEDAAQQMTLAETKAHLGSDRVHTKLLVEAGYLNAFQGNKVEGLDRMFLRKDLDRFLADLLERAVDVEAVRDDMAPIARAAHLANRKAMQIVAAILDGSLGWVGKLAGTHGYRAVLVSVREVKSLLRGQDLAGLTPFEVQKEMRCTHAVVRALIERGKLATTTAAHPVHRCPVRVVSNEELARFKASYVSLTELSKVRREHFHRTLAWLREKGVKPALHKADYHATFYDRASLP